MANDATMTVKAVFLPDEIQKTLENQSMTMSVGVGALKWGYGMVNVLQTTQDLIPASAQPLGTSSAGAKSSDAGTAVTSVQSADADEVRFLLIKNMGTTEDGSTASSDSVYLTIGHSAQTDPHDSADPAVYRGDAIEIGSGEIWYAKLNCQLQYLRCRSSAANFAGTDTAKVQCLVAAVIDTT